MKINELKNINILLNNYYDYSFYSRDNFISLQNIPYSKGITYLLSHEIAHNWFNNARIFNYSSDAFLNESLAEYMSYLYYRHIYGDELFKELIARKINESNKVYYSLSDVSRDMDGITREKILYTRGALICYKIESQIGEKRFKNLLQIVIKNKTSSILEFEEILKREFGEDVECLFKKLINNKQISL